MKAIRLLVLGVLAGWFSSGAVVADDGGTGVEPRVVPELEIEALADGKWRVSVVGSPDEEFHLEATDDLLNWLALRRFTTSPRGLFDTTLDSASGGDHVELFRARELPLPAVLEYQGGTLVLVVPGLDAGTVLRIDLDGDGEADGVATADDGGLATLALDVGGLPDLTDVSYTTQRLSDPVENPPADLRLERKVPVSFVADVAENVVGDFSAMPEPGICACDDELPNPFQLFMNTFTPVEEGVELATGKVRQALEVTEFGSRLIDFDFALHHASLVDYAGPFGRGMSHSYHMMVVRTGELTGQVVTPDLRIYPIASEDGVNWDLPEGFFSRLRHDPEFGRWVLTHYSGVEFEFFEGLLGQPGLPLRVSEPNGNVMRFGYDGAGRLAAIATTLGQIQRFSYGDDGRLASYSNHLGHTWTFGYNGQGCLRSVATPETEHANVPAGGVLVDEDLATALVNQSRVTLLEYGNEGFASHITRVVDARGAVPEAYSYDGNGRLVLANLNGAPVQFDYAPGAEPVAPLAVLDVDNLVVRVIDREGNVCDNEIMGPGSVGRGGLRRTVEWTSSGIGGRPLRPGEGQFWESRWLHDCPCLKAVKVSEGFGSGDLAAMTFGADGMPTNWPVTEFLFNPFRQVLAEVYSNGSRTIREEATYQEGAFGDGGEYSLVTSATEPRAFGSNPLYAGSSFVENLLYDPRGNLIQQTHPTLTLGQDKPVAVVETWGYNEHGQEILHVDANGNRTVTGYHAGANSGGDVNTMGAFAGYPSSVTEGAAGSTDGDLGLRTQYFVNALGDVTRTVDPRGFSYDILYNNLREEVRELDPPVDLPGDGPVVQYETQYVYDAVGNLVLERRSNFGASGAVPQNDFVDVSRSYDATGNVLEERQETGRNPADDLVTRYAYDGNERLIATVQPEGNREFVVFDERDLLLRAFVGVSPGANVLTGYPASKSDTGLGAGVSAVGYEETHYDGSDNVVRERDARGNESRLFYDFANRVVAKADANGTGETYTYDASSQTLTTRGGSISKTTGILAEELERTYHRHNELGTEYQQVEDVDLLTDESALVNPDDGANASRATLYDAGLRALREIDARGNTIDFVYDSADRVTESQDALGNLVQTEYDANDNAVRVTDSDVSGLEEAENYVTTYVYDSLNRLVEQHHLGLEDSEIDHVRRWGYDSRSNEGFDEDSMGLTRLSVYDDADRLLSERRFSGNPVTGGGVAPLLQTFSWAYDGNDNVVEERALGDVKDAASLQVTRYAYDALDRKVREVFADSDDPIDGSGDGVDSVFDRIERVFDANSNIVSETDQRGVRILRAFDPGDRLTSEVVVPAAGVVGETQRRYTYDSLNRLVTASNDFTRLEMAYDTLSRRVSESQLISPSGGGFFTGWRDPVVTDYSYDLEDNETGITVTGADGVNLATTTDYDELDRPVAVTASYFGKPDAVVRTYDWIGDGRFAEVGNGNGTGTTYTYDAKRRVVSMATTQSEVGVLTGFDYSYDSEDNVLSETWAHDGGRVDRYTYDSLYQLSGVDYRGDPGGFEPIAPADQFSYDSVFNRTSATFGDPFGLQPQTTDVYQRNRANEYVNVNRDGNPAAHVTDRAGNTTELPVRAANPRVPFFQVTDEPAQITWDGFNRVFTFQTLHSPNPVRIYLRDALGRRCMRLENSGGQSVPVQRYCNGQEQVICDRAFTPGSTLQDFATVALRVYVRGAEEGTRVLCAQDGDGDGQLAQDGSKNQPNPNGGDAEYYFSRNLMLNTAAILDADNGRRVLEFYKMTANGELAVLPELEFGGQPGDLQDNAMGATRASLYGNRYCYAGFRCEPTMGLHYCERGRCYYEPSSARYLRRCSSFATCGGNGYQYGGNNCWNRSRSSWLKRCRGCRVAKRKARRSWQRHVGRYKRRWWKNRKRWRCGSRGCGFRKWKRYANRYRKWKKRKRRGWRPCRWGYRYKKVCKRYRTWRIKCRTYVKNTKKCRRYRTWRIRCRTYRTWRMTRRYVWKKKCRVYTKRNYICSTSHGVTRCVRWSSKVVKCRRYRTVQWKRTARWHRSCKRYMTWKTRCRTYRKRVRRCWKVSKTSVKCRTRKVWGCYR